jgi:cell wall-associated NlpC family hydrolase
MSGKARWTMRHGRASRESGLILTAKETVEIARRFGTVLDTGRQWGVSRGLPYLSSWISRRPRYLGHASVAFVGLATPAAVVLQPHPGVTSITTAAPLVQPAMNDLDQQAPVTATAPDALPEQPTAPTAVPTPAKPFKHTVEPGETIGSLAAQFGLAPETILAANDITDPNMIRAGQELLILPTDGVLHTVQPGESIRAVAERFGISTTDIVAANDLGAHPDLVEVGQDILLPGVKPQVQTGSSQLTADGGQQAASIGIPQSVGEAPLPVVVKHVAPSSRTYTVQEGDTLRSIADLFGVDVPTILSSNGIEDPDTIRPGSELRILPTRGIEYEVQPGETLADIAFNYRVDLGLLLDYNDLNNPDVIQVGAKLVLPGAKFTPPPAPSVEAPAPPVVAIPGGPAAVIAPPVPAPAPKPQPAPQPAPQNVVGTGGAAVVANAMKYVGYPYVWGGTSPRGFDCSGFVYYVHTVTGNGVGRGMWQLYNGGPRVAMDDLLPGDTVFFANTYEPGLSHVGIYIGGGQFVHASDETTGVIVTNLHSAYWSAHYAGATRLWSN